MRAIPVLVPFALLLAACGSGDAVSEAVAQVTSPIINGAADTTHEAVVAIILQKGTEGGLCSGSIVKVDPTTHVGWVLTAAHCVEIPPVYVLQGDDFQAANVLRYDVIDYRADPGYTGTGSANDFAVIRIAGVDATTPVLALVSATDGLVNGTQVQSVGYGRTTLNASGSTDANSNRHNVAKTLSQVQQQFIRYNQSQSGICQGDSGGPVLVTSGSVQKVVGVHSFVNGDCDGEGVSGRVSYGLTFINGELGKAQPTASCSLCQEVAESGNSACASASRSCLADKDCKGYYECLSAGSTQAACVAKFPKAEGPFNAAANCACTTACVAECGASTGCRNVPKCGYKLPAGDCATCTESACCDEALACSADGECYVCLKTKDADPACATNAARKKMATCVATKCNTQCAGSGLDTGADPAPAEEEPAPEAAVPVTTAVTTSSGCSSAPGPSGAGSYGLVAVLAFALTRLRRR